ncbi:putative SUN domain-containing protein [Helianthus debilis subsp. tardiflorus]
MSSSTVSVTANPTGAPLRRHTPTAVKNSDLDPTDTSPVTAADTNSTKAVTETIPTKNPKLRKRTAVKSSRSPWKTAVSVIVKNLSLLVILLVLIQMIRRLGFSQIGGFESVFSPSLDYERRIADVEELVMAIENMMQVQVNDVDRKVTSEVLTLRSELGKRIDGERDRFVKRFSEFDGRVKSVERSLSVNNMLSKDEFDRFVEDLKGRKGVGEIGGTKLDEIRSYARGIVEDAIGKHAADGIGRVDYAVASGGAMVVRHSEGFSGGKKGGGWLSGSVRNDAVKMLQPSFGQPGECFPLKGDNGFVEIKLRSAVVPEAITLEHVSKSVAFDWSTAPKDCKVWGWSRNEENTQKEHLLTEFTYDLEKSSLQTFDVLLDTEGANPIIIDTVRLQFMSNHGSPTHTCIYRVRVHGHQPNVS